MAGRKRPGAAAESLGERIRRYRLAKGLTQVRFGEVVGIAQRTVAYYELKGTAPPPDVLVRMADALGVSTDVLLGRKKGAAHAKAETAPARPPDARRVRHLKLLDELPLNDRKAVFKIIDALSAQNARRRG